MFCGPIAPLLGDPRAVLCSQWLMVWKPSFPYPPWSPWLGTENFNLVDNNALAGAELEFAEELRDNANLRLAAYQQEVARGYNKNIWALPFNVGDHVLRMVVDANKLTKLIEWCRRLVMVFINLLRWMARRSLTLGLPKN